MIWWTARLRKELHEAWVTWAQEKGFSVDGHEDRFRGILDGVEVRIENGIRESISGPVEAMIHLSAGERLGVISGRDAREDDTARIAALREVLRRDRARPTIRIDAASFVVRTDGKSAPERVEATVRALIAAWRSAEGGTPYR